MPPRVERAWRTPPSRVLSLGRELPSSRKDQTAPQPIVREPMPPWVEQLNLQEVAA